MQVTAAEWMARLVQAEELEKKDMACPMCGGTGGWLDIGEFVICQACNGSGSTGLHSEATH
jgi:hypothetical protein